MSFSKKNSKLNELYKVFLVPKLKNQLLTKLNFKNTLYKSGGSIETPCMKNKPLFEQYKSIFTIITTRRHLICYVHDVVENIYNCVYSS